MNIMNTASQSPPIAGALLVSSDPATIKQLHESMQQLAMSAEVCGEVPAALTLVNQRKFEAVIVDLQLGGQANAVVEKVRRSPSNRTAVIFTVSDSDAESASAFKAGSNFVIRRPLSPASVGRSLKVAYGLILRERRRYFRCPVEIPAVISAPGMADAHGQTLNVSENGIAIATSAVFAPGVKVRLHFTLPDRESRFEVEAVVCWCKQNYLGFQFSSLSTRMTSELQEWLLHRLEESLPESLADKFRNLEKASP